MSKFTHSFVLICVLFFAHQGAAQVTFTGKIISKGNPVFGATIIVGR